MTSAPYVSPNSGRIRGSVVFDMDPPPALCLNPSDPISLAINAETEFDYTYLPIVSETRALIGYIDMNELRKQLDEQPNASKGGEPVSSFMRRFQRKGRKYQIITPSTPLEELEGFFKGHSGAGPQRFAIVTDDHRKFTLGVVTVDDLEKFIARRPDFDQAR